MLDKPKIARKRTMTLVNFYMSDDMLSKINSSLTLCQESEPINKSDLIREAINRGLESIRADIDGIQNLRAEGVVQS